MVRSRHPSSRPVGALPMLIAVLALMLLGTSGVAAQTGWTFGARYEHQRVDSDLPQWEDWQAERVFGQWRGASATARVQLEAERRFGELDRAAIADLYHNIGPKAYGNLRVRMVSDARVMPDWDARIELFRALGSTWEASASYWHMDFDAPVRIAGIGLARYQGNWYLRLAGQRATNSGESALSFSATARRAAQDGGSLVLIAGRGKEVVLLGAGPTIDLRTTSVAQVEIEDFITQTLGWSGALGHHSFEGAPSRLLMSIGVMVRVR